MIKSWSYVKEYKDLRKKILKSIDRALKSGQIFFGKELQKFEKKFISRSSLRPVDSPYGHCAANPGNDKNFEKKLDRKIKIFNGANGGYNSIQQFVFLSLFGLDIIGIREKNALRFLMQKIK